MTSRDFCYWLQGLFELHKASGAPGPAIRTAEQSECIERHLALVFKHEIDPSAGPPEHQAELNAIHDAMKMVEQKVEVHAASATLHGGGAHAPVFRC